MESNSLETLIGQPNESNVTICGVDAISLIVSGSDLTTVCEKFFKTLTPAPRQVLLEDLWLNLEGPDGRNLPFSACIIVTVPKTFCAEPITVLTLPVPDTRYKLNLLLLIDTNVFNRPREMCPADEVSEIPAQ